MIFPEACKKQDINIYIYIYIVSHYEIKMQKIHFEKILVLSIRECVGVCVCELVVIKLVNNLYNKIFLFN
jgi:hypothetical protein